MGSVDRRSWVAAAGWLAGVVFATGAGVGAVAVVGGDLTGPSTRALSEDEVRRELAAPGQPTGPAPTRTVPTIGSPQPTQTSAGKVLTSPGGSVLARCVDGQVSLDWWIPQQGYQVDDVDRGPGPEARIEFESVDDDVELRIICQGDTPTLRSDD